MIEQGRQFVDPAHQERALSIKVAARQREIFALDLGGRFVDSSNKISYLVPHRRRDILQPVAAVCDGEVLASLQAAHDGYVDHRARQIRSTDRSQHLRVGNRYSVGAVVTALSGEDPSRLACIDGKNILAPSGEKIYVVRYHIHSDEEQGLNRIQTPMSTVEEVITELHDDEYWYMPTLSVVFGV